MSPTRNLTDVTVCFPVWNAAANVQRCLTAVLDQPINGASILVVDNCSTDGTYEITQQLLKDLPNVRIVRNDKNVGRVENWNRCIELCETKFLKFALANDVLMRGSLKCLADAAFDRPHAVMYCSRFRAVDGIPNQIPSVQDSPGSNIRSKIETACFFAEKGCQTGGLNSMLLNMETIRQYKVRFREDIPYCSDYFFAIELAAKGESVFVDAETYLFDAAASGRFHFTGLKEPGKFFLEQRECARLLTKQLNSTAHSHEYLHGQYYWFLGQGAKLSVAEALEIFSDAPFSMRVRAAWNTWKCNLNRYFGRGIQKAQSDAMGPR